MPDDNREFATRNAAAEPGPQPDPMLSDGRTGSGRKWAVTAVIVVVLLAVMYGLTARRSDVNNAQRESNAQNAPTANSTVPNEALPGGRTTAHVPPTAPPGTTTRGPSQ
jgi:hypothetical protein